MTKPRKLKVYSLRDFARSAHLPRDVLDALGEPDSRRQGQILIWATSARAAYDYTQALGLSAVYSPRELGPAMGYDVDTLDTAYPWPDGTVLATGSFGHGPVVEIARQPGESRTARVVGHLGRPERPIFTPTDMSMVVTDAMVEAALGSHTCACTDMRTAIAAALRAQAAERSTP